MKNIDKTIALLAFIMTLSSCSSLMPPRTKPTEAMETAIVEARTSIVGTQLAIPTITQITTPSLTTTPVPPSITPTQTSTPVLPLISREWMPKTALITFSNLGGDGGPRYKMYLPNDFTLLSNGELYISSWDYESGVVNIQSTILSRQKICNLLNSIDQAGFFDYDPSIYEKESHGVIFGAEVTQISVQAWGTNSVSLYALDSFMEEQAKCSNCTNLRPIILPSIRKTYLLLKNYQPENLVTYQSDRLGVWVDAFADSESPTEWSVKSVKLSGLISEDGDSNNEPNTILTGIKAKTVYKLFNQTIHPSGLTFREGNKTYTVFARPLLPNEFISNPEITTGTLGCSPSDGWVTIP